MYRPYKPGVWRIPDPELVFGQDWAVRLRHGDWPGETPATEGHDNEPTPDWATTHRVVIVGNGGSGKTTVANQLGDLLNLPVIHLDSLYYATDWTPLDHEQFAAAQTRAVQAHRWIIEGNYASTLPIRLAAAHVVIVLDLHPMACIWGIIKRRRRHRGGQHPQVGVYDRITWNFLGYVLTYRRRMLPTVRRLIAEHAPMATCVILRGRCGVRRFLDHLQAGIDPR